MRVSLAICVAISVAAVMPAIAQDARKPGNAATAVSSSDSGAARDKQTKAALDNATLDKAAPDKANFDKRRAGLTAAREAAAMAFVKQHHPDLVDLLVYLKQNQPAAYEQAVMDLFRASERLAQQKEVNYDRYELDLALWKVESRIELVAARLKMAGRDSPEGETLIAQLKKLLEERHDLKTERLVHEREKIADRLEKIDRQLETLAANREQSIERELKQFVNQPSPSKPPQKNTKAQR